MNNTRMKETFRKAYEQIERNKPKNWEKLLAKALSLSPVSEKEK